MLNMNIQCKLFLLFGLLTGIVRLQGTDEGNHRSIVGGLPAASLLQTPGARADAATWCDEAGYVWLFGGEGYDSNAYKVQPEFLSDLWLLNSSRLEWNLMHSGTIQCTRSASKVRNKSKSSTDELCKNGTTVAPKPRKSAASCGVPGIIFVVFGGIDSKGSSLSDTWIYIIHKARWLPLSWNVTKAVHPPTVWSTKRSWCDLDALYVIGSSDDNVTQMWKLSLRTLDWSNESMYLTEHQQCTTSDILQPAAINSITIVWNGSFYLYQWQIVHSDSSSLTLSIDLHQWHLLQSTRFRNNRYSQPFLWSNLNLFNKGSGSCSSSSTFQQSYDASDNGSHSCNMHRCYTIKTGTSWPGQRLHVSSWFYEGNMYIFGGQAVISDESKIFFNDLCVLQQSVDEGRQGANSYAVLVLSLIAAVVTFVAFIFGIFCISRYCDYQLGRKKSRELRIRYAPLRDQTLYE